jgi:heme exporter protein A
MLKVTDLSCQRGRRVLFSTLNFELQPGQALWVRGPNGAGKTTLLRSLCGLSQAAQGRIEWQSQAIDRERETFHQNLLYLGHLNAIKEDLSPLENLRWQGNGRPRIAQNTDELLYTALHGVGLQGREHLMCRQLSQGQKRRVALARLLLATQKLWVLDEPFVALDDKALQWLGQCLQAHLQQGGLVVLTSHQSIPVLAGHEVVELNLATYRPQRPHFHPATPQAAAVFTPPAKAAGDRNA